MTDGMAETITTPVKEVEVEVITSDGDADAYKPKISTLEKRAEKDGNLAPMVLNMESQGATEAEIVQKVINVTISSELKREMAAPCVRMDASGYTKSNAAAIGMKLVDMALDGNLGAIREILNRTEGKVPTKTQNSSLSVKGNLADLMAKIDSNKGA